jgi:hypothetical protein
MTHPEKPGRSVEEIIGTTIYQDCSQKQRDELARYITENPEGVHETARKVALEEASGRIDAAVPILLTRLRNGQHRKRELQTIRGETDLVTFAECRYQAKMTSLAKHRTNPDEWNRTEALEYAVDWTIVDRKDCAMDSTELMTALCLRVGTRYEPRLVEPPSYTEIEEPPAAVVARAKALMSDDDDIPGYGDTP